MLKFIILLIGSMSFHKAYSSKAPTQELSQHKKFDHSSEEIDLLNLTNEVRIKKGLQPLKMNQCLVGVAREQSFDMAKHHHLTHTVKGKHLGIRIRKSGYPYRSIGENIARSRGTLPHVIQMWLKSPSHRKNLLNPNFKEVGIGIAHAKKGDRYFTQVFGTQR